MYSVMIVDKRKQMYTIYRDMIPWQQYQFEIISYCDSESQAMEHFCEHRHDLVITDIRLRSGDGISLLRQLKACSPDCHVIVCPMTAICRRCAAHGAADAWIIWREACSAVRS